MVTTSELATEIRTKVTYSHAADSIREVRRLPGPLPKSTIDKLYTHGVYLLKRYEFLLKLPAVSGNEKLITRGRYSMYNELCDFGLKEIADDIMISYKTSSE